MGRAGGLDYPPIEEVLLSSLRSTGDWQGPPADSEGRARARDSGGSDHPKLEHDWLWRLVAVSKIRQGVLPEDMFGDEDLPARPKIQKLVRPDKFIVIPDPLYETKVDLDKIAKEVPEDTVDLNWRQTLGAVTYDRNVLTITKTSVKQVRGKRLNDKRLELEVPRLRPVRMGRLP